MRIMQLVPELDEGGVERGVVELNRELVRHGIESLVVSAGGRLVEQLLADGGRHLTLDVASKNPFIAPLRVQQLRKLIRAEAPDLLHARSRVPAWLTFLANRSLPRPFVTTVHGFNSVNAYSRVMTFGDQVICVSGAIRDYVHRHYGVAEEKLVVIPRGVDLVQFDPARVDPAVLANFRQRFALEGRIVVSTVGRITQLKDYETFIRAIDLLRQEQPAILGLIVGGVHDDKRHYFFSLEQLVAERGLGQHIRFTGSLREVAEIYALSQVVVSSSKKPESFGRSAAEALAMEVPVVASRHGGILDIVLPGETGYLFAPGDVAALAAGIGQSLNRSWSGLRPFIETRFSLGQMVDKTLAVYQQLLATRAVEKTGGRA